VEEKGCCLCPKQDGRNGLLRELAKCSLTKDED